MMYIFTSKRPNNTNNDILKKKLYTYGGEGRGNGEEVIERPEMNKKLIQKIISSSDKKSMK